MAQVHVGRRLVACLVLAGALFAAALVTGSPALAPFGFLLLGIALWGIHLPRAVKVEARLQLARPTAVEDEPFGIHVQVANRAWRGRLLDIRAALPGPAQVEVGSNTVARYLRRDGEASWSFDARFQLFGLQRIGPVTVRVEDAFRLAAVEHEAARAVDLRVYPRRDPMRDPVLRAKQIRSVLGLYDVPQPGNSFEFYGLRDYHVGDRPRDVNWKASARTGGLVVNQHQKESDAEVVLLVDARAQTLVGRASRSPFAQGCRAALTVGEAHLRSRDAVRLIAYGDGLHEDRHTGATRRMQGLLDLAVGLAPAGEMGLAMAVRRILPSLKRRSPVMVFTPLLGDPTVQEGLSLLQSHELHVSVLVPQPQWAEATPTDEQRLWAARQKLAVRSLRRMGVPVAAHEPDAILATSLEGLEVRA